MDKRRMLAWVALVCGILTVCGVAREATRLDQGWRFKQGDVAGADQVSFDDKDWQGLAVPHSWGWEDAQQGKNYLRGPGWYRRVLNVGLPKPGRRYFLRFEAAGSVADVYLNGRSLGQHRGAFSAFAYEITQALSPAGTNVLAVRVSNAPEKDIAPLSGDFCVFGGLYRSVHLIETDEVCLAVMDHGSPGMAWFQTRVNKQQAVLDEDMRLILDMGCTVIRCAHYQHSDYFYGLCDKAGLLVWAEISQVDRIDPSVQFAETSRNQLLDLIRQNVNHPSIFAWSLYNELRPGNPDPHRLLQDLNALAHPSSSG